MVSCERLCIPLDGNQMSDMEVPFFGLLSVTTLEQWGLDVGNIVDITRLLLLT